MDAPQANPATGDPAVARLLGELRATEVWLSEARATTTELSARRATLLSALHQRGISIRALARESRLSRSAVHLAIVAGVSR